MRKFAIGFSVFAAVLAFAAWVNADTKVKVDTGGVKVAAPAGCHAATAEKTKTKTKARAGCSAAATSGCSAKVKKEKHGIHLFKRKGCG